MSASTEAMDEFEDLMAEEDEGEAWEYWHGRAMAAEAALYRIRELEPGTQQWVDGSPVDTVALLGQIFLIAAAFTTSVRGDEHD